MAIEASKKVLSTSNLLGSDIDLIVFTSSTPEYIAPSNAVKIHHAINGKASACVYDTNSNCVGMIVSLDQLYNSIMNNPTMKRVLLVGSEHINHHSKDSDEITYSNFGDAAVAIILERCEEANHGVIGNAYYTDSSYHDTILMPECGYSNISEVDNSCKKLLWNPFNTDEAFISAENSIESILANHNLTKKDVKRYFMSQFSKNNIDKLCTNLHEDISKFTYIGDEYGYTGCTSPFIAFATALLNNEIHSGDLVIFWSVGAGITSCCLAFRL
ncbi:3-oxoacyl-[acyl-carrier-protein] synthase III C-terminal domain-containing protein [Clostridium sp.]|uniref:3-oxoacyl-[acyl-carrier-protein] synthase III C-terminal domain-containing protein n=1 Tax=Clostridium sp. TaxID=1506 RepID=UPI003FD79FB2